MKVKTKVIAIRIPEPMYQWIIDLSRDMSSKNHRVTPSNLVRLMIEYFLMAYSLGEFKKPLTQVRKEFLDFLSSFEKTKT